MWEQLIQFVQEQITQNDLFKGGLLLMIGGAVLALLRTWPGRIWGFIKRQSMIVIDIPDRDKAFEWVNLWLAEHSYSKNWARLLTIRTERLDRAFSKPKIIFSPAPGVHWLIYQRRLIILSRERQQMGQEATSRDPFREYFTIRIVGRNREIVKQLIDEAYTLSNPETIHKITIHRAESYGDWSISAWVPNRPLESVILPEGITDSLVKDMKIFLDSEDWYLERGIPYRLGCLFYGPPGNGKTSAVMALATHFQMDIGQLNIKSSSMTDDTLAQCLSNVPKNTIILIEDIDCLSTGRESETSVTFSGLLNALDGLGSAHGQIVFMTTNHIDSLDPALIRPGRCDIRVNLDNANSVQIERMFSRFFPESNLSSTFSEHVPEGVSMAIVQKHLMHHRNDSIAAFDKVKDLINQ